MTKKESLDAIKILKIAYPHHYRGYSKDEAEIMLNLWTELFADNEFPDVCTAIKSYIVNDEKGFPPVIGVIKAKIRAMTAPIDNTPHPDGGIWLGGRQVIV